LGITWWVGFNILILILLFLDLKVFNKKNHIVKPKEAGFWALFWFLLAMIFNAFIYLEFGKQSATEFLTGYILEQSLSVDNLFVFVVIFEFFNVEPKFQHRVLFWGILGAIIMRTLMILLGTALIVKFSWVEYLFGGFLVFTAINMLIEKDPNHAIDKNPLVKILHKFFNVTEDFHEEKFFVKINNKLFVTPLFVVLILIETSDLLFAVDSIPAVIGITKNSFIVYTSNIFAILGLRNLYFLLSSFIEKFHLLKYSLSFILGFIGVKMLLPFFDIHISNIVSLIIIAIALGLSVIASFLFPKKFV
jgi:tellurite resistance protein TerC